MHSAILSAGYAGDGGDHSSGNLADAIVPVIGDVHVTAAEVSGEFSNKPPPANVLIV